jgi:hypothetical protein
MKKTLLTSLMVLSAVVLTHCRTKDVTPSQKYTDGVIILNEGNFSQANGNMAFYKFSSNEITPDVVKAENNGTGINATIQRTFDDQVNQKLYAVTNSPDQLLIFNGKTFKNEGAITTGLANPYGVAVASGKAFVSEWGTTNFVTYPNAKIQIVDVATRQITASIAVGKEVNGMLELNSKIYVAVTGGNEIWVINSNSNAVETKIATANKPNAMEVDANGKIWVLCSSGNLVRINPINNQVEATLSGVSVLGFDEKLAIDALRQNLYWISGTGIFRMSISATSAPTVPLITGDKFYGLGVNSNTNQIIAGVTNYSSIQEVHFYNTNGAFGSKIAANGYQPKGFLFR